LFAWVKIYLVEEGGEVNMEFQPTEESLKTHVVPEWYNDAKLGIFIHWGLYSVPAWAPFSGKDITEMVAEEGFEIIKKSPYAEWYMNSMQFKNYPTWNYHVNTYGADYSYDNFQKTFEETSQKMDPYEWADLFSKTGARYVVMVTKHHDGYLLWPSHYLNPLKPDFHSKRDLVGEVIEAVRKKGMKMGFYYSGVFDWSFLHEPIGDLFTFLLNFRQDKHFANYVESHFKELIDRYRPSILWNDIGSPPDLNIDELIAYYYNSVKEGVVNDRWSKRTIPEDPDQQESLRVYLSSEGESIARDVLKSRIPECHWDFLTPEYISYREATDYKWESTRGIGRSFGYNQIETEKDMISSEELIRLFVDIVSKNGNLLINVGPMADGTIPQMQQKPLKDLGAWLKVNGEALYNTRPWTKAEGKTADGLDIRYTKKGDDLYAILLDTPAGNDVSMLQMELNRDSEIYLLGHDKILGWKQEGDRLNISFPQGVQESPAYAFHIRRRK